MKRAMERVVDKLVEGASVDAIEEGILSIPDKRNPYDLYEPDHDDPDAEEQWKKIMKATAEIEKAAQNTKKIRQLAKKYADLGADDTYSLESIAQKNNVPYEEIAWD